MKRRYLPSLRGFFGDWTYYSCLVPVKELAERVSFATELRANPKLSEMIQRELRSNRSKDIATYLTTQNERFFNSLVVAVYEGAPAWHEFGKITPQKQSEISIEDLPDETRFSMGFLSFTGKERLFTIDGQHRLAGMKRILKEQGDSDLLDDQVPVIFVAHKVDNLGVERSRRLFTTLNKNARPVNKGEIIALDEDDVMAICVRRLVEHTKEFGGERVSYNATNNLLQGDRQSLTTIGALYDVLSVLFSKVRSNESLKDLKFNRPSDDELDEYFEFALEFFRKLGKAFPALGLFFRRSKFQVVVEKERGDFGGHVLFRPVGLKLIVEVISELAKTDGLDVAMIRVARLPHHLSELPFNGLIWDESRARMASPQKGPLTRDLLLYMLGEKPDSAHLRRRYAEALGKPGELKTVISQLKVLD